MCNICIAVYYPLKYQLTSYRGYKVLGEDGLGSVIRSAILLKHRFGNALKVFPLAFQGSVGKFLELPKPEKVDYSLYQAWKGDELLDEVEKDTAVKDTVEKDSKPTKYSF